MTTFKAEKAAIKLTGKKIDIYRTINGKYYFPFRDVSDVIEEIDYLDNVVPIESDGTHLCNGGLICMEYAIRSP